MPKNMLQTGILFIIKVVTILNEGFFCMVADICETIEEMFRDEKARLSESSDDLKIPSKEPHNLISCVENEVTMEREKFEEFLEDLNNKLTEIFNHVQHIKSGIKSRTHLGHSGSTENEEARSCSYRSKKSCSPKTNERKTCIFLDKSTKHASHESESEIQSKYNFDDARNKARPSSTTRNQNLSSTGLENRENVVECKVSEIRSSSSEESDSYFRPGNNYRVSSKRKGASPIANGMVVCESESKTESVCDFDDARSLDCEEVSGDASEMRVKTN